MARTPGRPAADAETLSRKALLEAAFEEFANQSFQQVSLRALAKKLGVSDSLFNHHFGSKQKLWLEVVDSIMAQEFSQLIAELELDPNLNDPLSTLRSYIQVMLTVGRDKPAMFKLIFRALEDEEQRAQHVREQYIKPYLKTIDRALQLCIEHGQIRPISSISLHTLILGTVNILIRPEFVMQGLTRKDNNPIQVSELVEIVMLGIKTGQ